MTGKEDIPMLVVDNLSVAFQTDRELVRAVKNVSLSISRGQGLGLWGHSGCGKSTVMKSLLALAVDEPGWVGGSARFGGLDIVPEVSKYVITNGSGVIRKNCMAFQKAHRNLVRPLLKNNWRVIFQEPIYSFEEGLPLGNQIKNTLKFYAASQNADPDHMYKDFVEILNQLNLDYAEISFKTNRQLSGGECQRIALALSLTGSVEFLIADEPTTAMDAKTSSIAAKIIREKIISNQTSLLLASHNRAELVSLVDHILVMYQGQLVESMSKATLSTTEPEKFHPYTQRLWFAVGDVAMGYTSANNEGVQPERSQCPYSPICSFPPGDPELSKKCHGKCPPFFDVGEDHRVACWKFECK